MHIIFKLILIFLICDICKILYNAYYYYLAKKYLAKYNQYVQNYVDNESDWSIQENKHRIIGIFQRAGLKDSNLSFIEPGGFGFVKTVNCSLFDNIPLINKEVLSLVVQFFKESIGIFKHRMFDSINPVYWVETFIFLPKKTFSYLGMSADGLLIKIFQVSWWLVVAASTIIGIIFNPELRMWLSTHFR